MGCRGVGQIGQCPQCHQMLPVPSFSFQHSKDSTNDMHSLQGSDSNYNDKMERVDIDIAQTGNYNLLTHLGTETEVSPFIKGEEKFIAVLGAGKVTILFNVCKRQTILYCSKHASMGKYFGKRCCKWESFMKKMSRT